MLIDTINNKITRILIITFNKNSQFFQDRMELFRKSTEHLDSQCPKKDISGIVINLFHKNKIPKSIQNIEIQSGV